MKHLLPIALCLGCVAKSTEVGSVNEDGEDSGLMDGDSEGDVEVEWRLWASELALNVNDLAVADDGVLAAVAAVAYTISLDSHESETQLMRISPDGEIVSQRLLSSSSYAQVEALGPDIILAYELDASVRVERIDPTGAELWSTDVVELGQVGPDAMEVDAGTIAIGGHDTHNTTGFVIVLDPATGSIRWTKSAPSDSFPPHTLALVPEGRLAITLRPTSETHSVVVFGPNGEQEADYQLDPALTVARVRFEPGGLRLAGWRYDRLLSGRLGFDGALQWDFDIASPYGWAIEFAGDEVVVGGDVSSDWVGAFDATGETIWRLASDVPIFGVTVFGDRVYAYDSATITAIHVDG